MSKYKQTGDSSDSSDSSVSWLVYIYGSEDMDLEISRDTEGYLVHPGEWDEAIAIELASEEGITLNDNYWLMLRFMQQYYQEHNVAPDVRH